MEERLKKMREKQKKRREILAKQVDRIEDSFCLVVNCIVSNFCLLVIYLEKINALYICENTILRRYSKIVQFILSFMLITLALFIFLKIKK